MAINGALPEGGDAQRKESIMTYFVISKDGNDLEQRNLSERQARKLITQGYS
jgi:hypothetical protein